MSIYKRGVIGKRCILVLQIFIKRISSDNRANIERSQLMPGSQFNDRRGTNYKVESIVNIHCTQYEDEPL